MFRLVCLILVLFTLIGCEEENSMKAMKYTRHGENLSCNGYYKNDILQKVVCFSNRRDTILEEFYSNGLRQGNSVLYYDNGDVKEEGRFDKGFQTGEWIEYFPNKVLKSYRVFEIRNDSSFMIYEKVYNENGILTALRYPLRFRTNNDLDTFDIGVTYQLFVDLMYTQFDSLHSYGLIKDSPSSSVLPDTVKFEGNSLYVDFKPITPGNHSIKGTYMEINALAENEEKGYGGEREWSFSYFAQ